MYQHKAVAIRRREGRPEPGEWPVEPSNGMDPVAWFRSSLAVLLDEFAAHEPDAPCWTWYGPEQNVAFWYRRMAHETAVHRVDVELAVGSASSIPDDMAVDGVDEVLERCLAYDWLDEDVAGGGESVLIDAGAERWRLRLLSRAIGFERGEFDDDRSSATVSGDPAEVFLWLWGGRPVSAVQVTGDAALVRRLREHYLAASTQ